MVETLYQSASETPRYAQLSILDPAEATDHRAQTFQMLQRSLLERLLAILTEPARPVDAWTGEAIPTDPSHYLPRNPYPAQFIDMLSIVQSQQSAAREAPSTHALRFARAPSGQSTKIRLPNI